jgi:hypothetical protein
MFRRRAFWLLSASAAALSTPFLYKPTIIQAENQSDNASALLWTPPTRREILSKLRTTEEYDLLIIGAGATGGTNTTFL